MGPPSRVTILIKSAIHFLHLISIGHAPLFHIVSYMEILFLISHYHYIIKNEGTKNSSMCWKAYVFNIKNNAMYMSHMKVLSTLEKI
jgi:hypothetical protein